MESGKNLKRILIVETQSSGHYLVYVRLLAQEAISRGCIVVLATTEQVTNDSTFEMHLGDLREEIRIALIDPRASLTTIQELGSKLAADVVVIPNALAYGQGLLVGRRRKEPGLRLLMMNDPRWRLEGSRKLEIGQRAKILFFRLASMRRSQSLFWLRPSGYISESERYFCDPVVLESTIDVIRTSAAEMRQALGMSDDVFWFGLVGAISEWKNPFLVTQAVIAASRLTKDNLGIAFIGPWRNENRADIELALRQASVGHVIHDRILTNENVNAAVAALDCLVLAYSTFAPNSTTAKAATLGVRTIIAGPPSFRRFGLEVAGVQGIRLGEDDLVKAMLEARNRPVPVPRPWLGTSEFTDPLLRGVSSQ